MKNVYVIILLLFCFVFDLSGQITAPESLNDSLKIKYNEADKIIWNYEDSTDLWVANFRYFKNEVIAKYTKDGLWIKSISEANFREVPYKINEYLKTKYTKDIANTIDKIYIYEFKDIDTYYLALIKSQGVKERVKVYFSLSGKFLNAIEPKEYIQKNATKTKESLEDMILNDDF